MIAPAWLSRDLFSTTWVIPMLLMAGGILNSRTDFGGCSSSQSLHLGGDNDDEGLDVKTAGHTCG